MKLAIENLDSLVGALRERAEIAAKKDVQVVSRVLPGATASAWFGSEGAVHNGDDCAALPCGDEYVLFAAEGMRREFVRADPWFAGFCAVMVNVSDVCAMGGRPWAITDVLYLGDGDANRVLEGMVAASQTFGVPIVGGHTTRVAGDTMLAAAVVGRARRLITSYDARPGELLVHAVDLRGSYRGEGGNFNAATSATPENLRRALALLPELAEAGLVRAGKDISMAGLCGTLVMLLECSRVGARLDLDRVVAPSDADPLRWLMAFPSYGYVLTVRPEHARTVCSRFEEQGISARVVGEVTTGHALSLSTGQQTALYWDLGREALTGFGGAHA